MNGLFVNIPAENSAAQDDSVAFQLLGKQGPMEIMRLTVEENDAVWLSRADDDAAMEFFYLLSGALTIAAPEGPIALRTGGSFYLNRLAHDIPVRAETRTELLYVTNSPMYDSSQQFEESLRQLLLQINEKDHYTYRHSGNVMHYVRVLYECLREACGEATLDELMVAALFHDVGKCYVPDAVLQKRGELEQDDVRQILRHPRDSARLLRPHFGARVAEIAANHHERLDGSGYPCGYCAEDMSFAARLLAVADVFDAMTTDRGYNVVKDDVAAARELYGLAAQFDRRITEKLLALAMDGRLEKPKGREL